MAKEKSPAMQFYGREFYQDENVIVMTLEQEAAYMRLLWNCWQEGSIPSEPAKLAALCKNHPAKRFSTAVWPALQGCFVPSSDGRLIHSKVEKLRAERRDFIEHCSAGGKHSSELRAAQKSKLPSTNIARSLQVTLPEPCKSEPTLQSPVSSLQEPPPTPSAANQALAGAFERWIAEYPNAVRVDSAAQSWLSLIELGEITDEELPELFAGLQRWKDSRAWADEDGKYIPAPNVFLTGNEKHRGRMWKDHPPASAEAKASRKGSQRSGDGVDPASEWVPSWKKEKTG